MAREAGFFSIGKLFSPRLIGEIRDSGAVIENINQGSISGSQVKKGSFKFDKPGSGFKSTQQIPLDWSDFSQHTFFNSAESKVNVAFDTIINYFPFDGNREQVDNFVDDLSGFEKYVLDEFPKNIGFLHFKSSFISVADHAGSLYPYLSRDKSGKNIIYPDAGSISFEFFAHIPSESNNKQTIFQKLSTDAEQGISLFLSESASSDTANLFFTVTSGSAAMVTIAPIEKGGFRHITAVWDKDPNSVQNLKLYLSGVLQSTSSQHVDIGLLNFANSNFIIGSGSEHKLGSYDTQDFKPTETFSGSLDEFRVWGYALNKKAIATNLHKSVFSSPKLRLYYKFNEATGSYNNNAIVLDSSGNSLHSRISNFTSSLRDNTFIPPGLVSPVILEDKNISPVLFPSNLGVVNLNSRLLSSASEFDSNNPNLITNLIPSHYLREESMNSGYGMDDEAGTGDAYSYTTDFPGGGKLGSPQIIASLLFTWAKFFDEIKIYIDQFGKLLSIDYDSQDTIADQMLPFFAQHYGFTLPNQFSNSSFSQYELGEDLNPEVFLSPRSLRTVQSEIWRRILVNFNEIIKSKGTIYSIKALMRAAGIDPETNFRFREFGGSINITTKSKRTQLSEVSSMLYLTSSNALIKSPYLSGSRREVGFPWPKDTSTWTHKDLYPPHGISAEKGDGLFTSGSWTFEGIYKFNTRFLKGQTFAPYTASLVRILATGSTGPSIGGGLLANLVGFGSGSSVFQTGSIAMYARPTADPAAPSLELVLTGVNIFDESKWHISFGRSVGNATSSFATSSYFIRAAKLDDGALRNYYATSSFIVEGNSALNMLSNISGDYNVSGSYLEIGQGSIGADSGNLFLNSATKSPKSQSRTVKFKGKVAQVRFWSSALSEEETKEHAKNFKSLGVSDPYKNFNFVTTLTGSFEKLRLDASMAQITTRSDDLGNVTVFDYSQNKTSGSAGAPWRDSANVDSMYFHMSGSGFVNSTEVIKPEYFIYTILNPKWDERSSDNKIRVAGYENDINIQEFNTLKAPVHHIELGKKSLDDTRFSIEVSSVRALNEDIINILSSLDFFDDAIGSPELIFADSYPKLAAARDVYFNRLEKQINYKQLFEFYKWFDSSLSIMIERLIPRTTKFLGINFVIESHALERAKMRYLYSDIYLGENDRIGLQTDLYLQQIVAILRNI